MAERVTADRLILVNVVNHWFYLRQPTFIDAGLTYPVGMVIGSTTRISAAFHPR